MIFQWAKPFLNRLGGLKTVVLALSFFAFMVHPDMAEARESPSHTGKYSKTYSRHSRSTYGPYKNPKGASVRSPVKTRSGKAPAGASARCRDGSYSFSQSRRGTCSHHGGVGSWL